MGLRVTCFHWSRDLSSSAQHGPGGASFTPGALASPPSAGGLAHHRTCLRGSPLGYPSARRIHLDAQPDAQAVIRWSAQHPVPLPA
ncbi:hypothetical protein COCSUDRAFT_60561 [Coccomyxa subellipsoidea C-169]|uniref:Uncharacterized protein n=1 Tax=Coccomyxa subellipsoidea (strain C-169) TaxID=574566 RepID=I0YIH3_COCSC|nr:hypothetical protein COCSUDRAFT_60561 [Coccomyxa subellipsoidea C-169]EIE18192.1 hypothetical protein COCSUDRAFT_60561 [Coccomyxa subellipsoidea C-169]|eukprot:XP_005642736.1 hypothetical protein COCSUDRAFT_60561 [Coccomyxa subellipsoidea C-169]